MNPARPTDRLHGKRRSRRDGGPRLGDRITKVQAKGSSAAEGATVIDAPSATLMPGMIDLHMHMFQWGQRHDIPWQKESILDAGLRGVRNASTCLDMGVTTARDVASRDNLSIQMRDLIRAGVVRGPRYYASGTQLEAAGRAAFSSAIYINGPDEARAAARRQLRAGADWMKTMATAGVGGGTGQLVGDPGWQELTEEEMHAAAVEAHHQGARSLPMPSGRRASRPPFAQESTASNTVTISTTRRSSSWWSGMSRSSRHC